MSQQTFPDRTHDQRLASLRRANAIRTYRAEAKRNLAAGADPIPMLTNPSPELHTMKVTDFLTAIPKIGRVKANRIMLMCRISQSKTVGGMSERQRGELVRELT